MGIRKVIGAEWLVVRLEEGLYRRPRHTQEGQVSPLQVLMVHGG